MQKLTLEANYRSDMSKSHMKKLRKAGYVTGSVYGRDFQSIPIEVKLRDVVDQVKSSEAGIMSLIDLKVKGAPEDCDGTVIIKGFYKDPLTRRVLDIQFQRVSLEEKVNVDVPVVLVGEAIGAREGGIVEQVTDTLEISCLPTEIPPRIEVDITNLAIGHHISVGDLTLKEGIEVRTDPSTIICTCVAPHVSHVEEAVEAAEAPATAEKTAEE